MATFTISADTSLVTKPKYLRSWHFAETAAAAAQVLLRDGGASGPIVAPSIWRRRRRRQGPTTSRGSCSRSACTWTFSLAP